MAFNKTPLGDTYQTKLVPLLKPTANRRGDRNYAPGIDMEPLNVIYEKVRDPLTGEEFYEVMSRDGFTSFMTVPLAAGDTVRGVYYWKAVNILLVAATTRLLVFSGINFTLLSTTTFPGSATLTEVDFQEYRYEDGAETLIVSLPGRLFEVAAGGGVTTISSTVGDTFGRPIVVMDGYVFATDGSSIWNSNLNNPKTWIPSNFIDPDNYPGFVWGLYRMGTYIVAFCDSSLQFFYNAANPNGTPLGVNQTATKRVGTVGGECLVDDSIVFVGKSLGGGLDVYHLQQQSLVSIGTPTIRRWLSSITSVSGLSGRFGRGKFMVLNGHRLYLLNHPTSPYSYVYDFDTQEWIRFSGFGQTSLDFSGTFFGPWSNGITSQSYATLAVRPSSADVFRSNSLAPVDGSTNVPLQVLTENLDFYTRRQKFASRLLIHCDQQIGPISVSWSDDDYATFTTPRIVDTSTTFPVLHQLGSFRKRAFRISQSNGAKCRWKLLELDYDQGQT